MAAHHEGKHSGGHHHYHPHPQSRYYYGYYGPYYRQAIDTVTDEDIKSDVESALRTDAYVDAGEIDVSAENGVITLKGNVGSPLEKRAAGDDAWDTPGVVDVDNQLKAA